jgi:hypothetical protein
VAAARGRLDEATFMAAWAQGRAMSIDRAVDCALEPVLEVRERQSTGRRGRRTPPEANQSILS